jgi:hypothetical protein
MNLTARERQALRSLESGLAESDPDLIATMAKLARLMVDEDRPAAEPSRRAGDSSSSAHSSAGCLAHVAGVISARSHGGFPQCWRSGS